jgi:hypothetical protein
MKRAGKQFFQGQRMELSSKACRGTLFPDISNKRMLFEYREGVPVFSRQDYTPTYDTINVDDEDE